MQTLRRKRFSPVLNECIIVLAMLQVFLASTIPSLERFQIPVEIILITSLLCACTTIKYNRWQISLIIVFLAVTAASFAITDTRTFMVNAKQNGLGVLSLLYFSKVRFKSKIIFPVFMLTLLLVIIHRIDLEVLFPFIQLAEQKVYNLSRPGGVFLNAHYNGYFMSVAIIYYAYKFGYKKTMYGLGLYVMFLTASKTLFLAYLAHVLSDATFFKYLVKYSLIIIAIVALGIYGIFQYRDVLIDYLNTPRYGSGAVLINQLSDPAYYTVLLNPFPGGNIDVSMNAITTIRESVSGHNEIGYFAFVMRQGIFLAVIYFCMILKNAWFYRVFILFALIHNYFIVSPLIVYMIVTYSREIHYMLSSESATMRSVFSYKKSYMKQSSMSYPVAASYRKIEPEVG